MYEYAIPTPLYAITGSVLVRFVIACDFRYSVLTQPIVFESIPVAAIDLAAGYRHAPGDLERPIGLVHFVPTGDLKISPDQGGPTEELKAGREYLLI